MLLRLTGNKSALKSDEELISGFCSAGSLELLGELYSRYMHLVYGVCIKYLKDRYESQDAVMQIFEKLITDIPKQKIENFRNWLHVVTRNYCLMQIRSRKSLDEKQNEWLLDPGNFMENHSYQHPIDKNDPDIEKALAGCIEKLKEEQKKCIIQFYFENKCYAEIAVDLGIDEKKVKSYLQNGKRNLKICIEESNEKEG
jgi:RNA polymerase sigma-70 factor, ECF subfamily